MTWRMIEHHALRSLLTGIKNTRFSWNPDAVADLCRQMGWNLVEVIDGKGAFAEAGWGLRGNEIRMKFRDGHVDDMTIRVTEIVRQDGPDRDRFLADAFADAVAQAEAIFGEPTARDLSEPPTVRWRQENSTVLIKRLEVAVSISWASNQFQDDWDRVREALA